MLNPYGKLYDNVHPNYFPNIGKNWAYSDETNNVNKINENLVLAIFPNVNETGILVNPVTTVVNANVFIIII